MDQEVEAPLFRSVHLSEIDGIEGHLRKIWTAAQTSTPQNTAIQEEVLHITQTLKEVRNR